MVFIHEGQQRRQFSQRFANAVFRLRPGSPCSGTRSLGDSIRDERCCVIIRYCSPCFPLSCAFYFTVFSSDLSKFWLLFGRPALRTWDWCLCGLCALHFGLLVWF
ncbi:hypothetical protein KC19_7G045600 [Ceratodon purpureus]|uniref:Transmembrane protein n=1 Tax=Ceratodon purpureus TaxID=3225 RepID=A0A8T0H4L7_CERPU|nr:hypothetical protein KC19_7G045600 [Ceratodon purpureus]